MVAISTFSVLILLIVPFSVYKDTPFTEPSLPTLPASSLSSRGGGEGSPLLVTRLWDDGVDQVAGRVEHGMDRLTELFGSNRAKELLVELEVL